MLAHTHKFTQLLLDQCPRKNPTWENWCSSEDFILLCSKELSTSMDAQLEIQTARKSGQNTKGNYSSPTSNFWDGFAYQNLAS